MTKESPVCMPRGRVANALDSGQMTTYDASSRPIVIHGFCMLRIRVLVITLCLLLLAAPFARAGEWLEDGQFNANQTYEPGRGKALLIGTFMGMATGFVVSGLVLIFYTNPDADRNFDTVMYVTVPIFTVGGVILGSTVPVGAAAESSAASLEIDDGLDLSWRVPQITAAVDRVLTGATDLRCHTNLLSLSF